MWNNSKPKQWESGMNREIEMDVVQRIWSAEGELRKAIDDGVKHGIVVEITTHKFSSGTESPQLLIKKLILPE
jgi:hypothetical protein